MIHAGTSVGPTAGSRPGPARGALVGRRPGVVALAFVVAAWSGASADGPGDCLPVRGWATLEDPIRLCAYLTDETEAEACESRGYRLGDGLSEAEVEVAGQFLLLCANEYVIAVSRRRGDDDTLLVTTAFVVDEGVEAADAGYYNSGRERVLQRVGGGWVERPSAVTWTE
jgi:hypothetical protein